MFFSSLYQKVLKNVKALYNDGEFGPAYRQYLDELLPELMSVIFHLLDNFLTTCTETSNLCSRDSMMETMALICCDYRNWFRPTISFVSV
jgi:hypothetical protein